MSEVVFTVTSVNRTREWVDGHGGSNTSYYVSQDLNDLEVEIAQRAIKDPVRPGQRWKGTVVPRTYNQETFYKLQDKQLVAGAPTSPSPQAFSAPESAPNGSSPQQETEPGKYDRRPSHPLDAARMSRCHAQEMAIRWAALHPSSLSSQGSLGSLDPHGLLRIIDWFERDVEERTSKIVNRPALPSLAGSETAAQAEGVISEPPPSSAALEASEASW